MYKFQDDYYGEGEDYYGEGEDYGVSSDGGEEVEEENDAEEVYNASQYNAELAENEPTEGLSAISYVWALVPVIDIALGVFYMTKTKDLDNSAWKKAYFTDLGVGASALLTYFLGVVFESSGLFLWGTIVNSIGEIANLFFIYSANKEKVVDAAKPSYGYIGHGFNLFLSLAVMWANAADGSAPSEVEADPD